MLGLETSSSFQTIFPVESGACENSRKTSIKHWPDCADVDKTV